MKTIEVLDPVHCKANAEAREVIKHSLVYESEFWKQGQFHMEQTINQQFLITGRKGTAGHFLTGLLPRIKKYCKQRNIKLDISSNNNLEKIKPNNKPSLNSITFRKDQLRAIRKAKRIQRGLIIAPTGSGKTIVALGVVSMFKKQRTIFIMHTKDLWNQTKEEALSFKSNLPPIYTPSGSKEIKDTLTAIKKHPCLIICLIQSLAKTNINHYIDLFDLTIIDEAHHVISTDSQYGHFMQHNLSPIRIGFTATKPTKQRQVLTNEGLIGPVIGELTIEEALEKGIIAKPKVKLISVPYNAKINKEAQYKYTSFYKLGIVENKARNDIISKLIKKFNKRKWPALVIVEKLDHGKILKDIILRRHNIDIPFVQGLTNPDERNDYKQKIIDGHINSVIVTRVWLEGINIKRLRVIIYAAGMKEKKRVLQAMGRGLRTDHKKKEVLLIDFLDPYRYLAEHSIQRIQVFIDKKWL